MWGYDDVGSSPDPCSNTYRGTEAFSEPETETIREFVLSHNFITVFNCHTHGDVLLRPFGYSPDVEIPEPDLSTYLELGADLVTENGYEFGTGMETLNYGVNGDAIDWMYGSEGIISFVPEIGNGFWPASDLIMSIVNENIPMNLHLTAVADFTPRLESFVFDTEEVIGTGGTYPAEIVVRNKAIVHGDETEAVTVTVFSPDSSISVPIPEYNITDLQALSSDTLNDSYTILAQNSQIATLVIGLSVSEGSNAYTLYDTLVWRIGPPDTLFSDDFENGMDQWLSDSWALTDAGYENTTGLTDSPDGEYQDNDEAEVILIETLDLSSMVAPELRFDVTWDIENGWDFAQVRASCNGGLNWVPLEGSYTSRGTGMGAQEAGEPGYDGSSDWVHESMSLEAFAECEEVTLQFILLSDTYVTGDGITIDNVHVIAWNPAFSGLLGDLNLDDTVNVQDVVLMISWIIESVDPGDAGLAAADLNRDQQLNILDVILLIELILSQ